jgi:hypothetical protein
MPDLLKNPYNGINAHHNSYLQTTGNWKSFHNYYLAQIHHALKKQVLPLGYTVSGEESIQVRRPAEEYTVYYPDLLITDAMPVSRSGQSETLTIPLVLLLEEEVGVDETPLALLIRKKSTGEPVAWLELLSPSNKPPSKDFLQYEKRRTDVLQNQLVFVEIDFLHHQPPTWRKLVQYHPKNDPSFAYRIIVINPRPTLAQGTAFLGEFGVQDPIPSVPIPIVGG